VLTEENDQQVSALLARHTAFERIDLTASPAFRAMPGLASAVRKTGHGLMLTPLRTGTDGFYVSALRRRS
jgi:16S rRNA (cytosine967-C5)-methyltransferase